MKIHHLNCGSMCPHGRRLLNGEGGWLASAELCCHCLLIETREGLVLVDTGLGTQDLDTRNSRLPLSFRLLSRPQMNIRDTALHQIKERGFSPNDVRHIVLTHLDPDHAGGLSDFPNAQVHVFEDELHAAMNPKTMIEKARYVPKQWQTSVDWHIHQTDGERWNEFDSVRALSNKETDILLVPTRGHTRGHCAVAVKSGEGWLLHCGDAYFHQGEMAENPQCPEGLKLYQKMMAVDNPVRLDNQARLRELAIQANDVQLICAHDPAELRRIQSASASRHS